jgi:pimeloyl-ACP methyl ester carboxylesterase
MDTVTAADGTRIAFTDSGDGPPLVLVHGITESARAWDPVRRALEDRWRVVAVDLRGHGESERRDPYDAATLATDVHAVVEATGVDEPLMVGHSLGGVVVTVYAGAGFPARGVVNVDQPIALGGFKEALEPLVPMLRGGDEDFATAMRLVFSVLDGPLSPTERARLDALATLEPEVVLGIWNLVLTTPPAELDLLVADLAGGITVPYLSLHGSDPGDDYPDWLRAIVPGALVEVWPEAGHYPQLTAPDRFVRRLATFDR